MTAQFTMAETPTHLDRKRLSVGRLGLILLATAALLLSAWWWRASPGKGPEGTTPGHSQLNASESARAANVIAPQSDDVLVTTLTASGFDPSDLSHAPGSFQLKVINQSGLSQSNLLLSNANGDTVSQAQLTGQVRFWKTPVQLDPGTYTLSEANNASWLCRIVVAAQ
jgi:hypothetical protein